jgi:hypothetical protein
MNRAIPFALLSLAPLIALPTAKALADIWDFKVCLDGNGELTQEKMGHEGSYFHLYVCYQIE